MEQNIKTCNAISKKMCEEPCISCSKCWGIKVCHDIEWCQKSFEIKEKCKYQDELMNARKMKYRKNEKKRSIKFVVYILLLITLIAMIIANIANFIYAYKYDLTYTKMIVRSLKEYWYIYIALFIEYYIYEH